MFPFLVYGCSSAGRRPEPVIEPTPGAVLPTATPPGPSGRSWTITPGTQPSRYSSTATVSLELTSDSAVIREAITQRARFSLLTGSAFGSTSFLGSIEAITTDVPSRIAGPATLPAFPVTFTGHVLNGLFVLDALNGQPGTTATQCSNPAASALGIIQRNIIALPTQLTQGMTWKDSTVATGCNGTIPTVMISIRNYRVAGAVEVSGRPAIAIERAEKTLSSGEGSESQHRILLKAEATGTAKIYVDRVSGALLSSVSEQQGNVTITAGRARRFKQTVKEITTIEN